MHTFYLIDDYTDKADVYGAKKVCITAIKAIEQPESLGPNDHALIGEIALQYVLYPRSLLWQPFQTVPSSLQVLATRQGPCSQGHAGAIHSYMANLSRVSDYAS